MYVDTNEKYYYINLFQNIQFNNLLTLIKTIFSLGWNLCNKKGCFLKFKSSYNY